MGWKTKFHCTNFSLYVNYTFFWKKKSVIKMICVNLESFSSTLFWPCNLVQSPLLILFWEQFSIAYQVCKASTYQFFINYKKRVPFIFLVIILQWFLENHYRELIYVKGLTPLRANIIIKFKKNKNKIKLKEKENTVNNNEKRIFNHSRCGLLLKKSQG